MLDERWSPEADEIGEALARLLDTECTPERVRAAEACDDGRDPALEAALAAFGILDMELPADILARISMELGRRLAPVAIIEALPAHIVLGQADTAYGFDGPVSAALGRVAFVEDGSVKIEPVTGTPRRTAAGDFLIQHRSAGTGQVVGDMSAADRMRRLMRLLEAARLVGAGQALLRYGTAYASEREQFGKVIGSYQGVAHRLANSATALDGAELLVRKAAFTALDTAGGDGAPAEIFAHMVHAKAVDAARLVATTVHQTLGGNGFAMEYDVQLYSRRIRSWSMRTVRTGKGLAEVARIVLDPARRDAVKGLWHYDQGMPLPRWAMEADNAAS